MDTLSELPLDPMLALLRLLRSDPRPDKIDLGIGVYRDDSGRTPILTSVKRAEQILVETQESKDYLSPEGDPAFIAALAPLVLGPRADDERRWGMQTPGGTGALRLAFALLQRTNPEARVWLGSPTWANHAMLVQASQLESVDHPFFDVATQTVQFDAMMIALDRARPGDAVVLHAACHNPTGADFTQGQWRAIADRLVAGGLIPILDSAYQGLGHGLENDAWSLRHILDRVPEALVAVSCSKTFGLYRDRIGALWVQGTNAASVRRARANLNLIARVLWSMPPDHGASVVRTILASPALATQWCGELDAMRARLTGLRASLAATVPEFSAVARQSGMFSLLPLDRDTVTRLRNDHGVYMMDNGRINLAGFNAANLPAFAQALRSSR
ncbi:MAG: aspartate/tyrosine/aromatic aminotransferase [Asticcacaulis sp.]|nr:aspartate/tyrosine/aromatic aminotransferase [Asticcacaulis sp.]